MKTKFEFIKSLLINEGKEIEFEGSEFEAPYTIYKPYNSDGYKFMYRLLNIHTGYWWDCSRIPTDNFIKNDDDFIKLYNNQW